MTGEQEYTEQTDTEHTQLRAELWMREYSLSTYDRQQTVLAQLQELAENAHLDALSVNTWYKYITTATSEYPDGTAITALNKIHEFEEWADQNGYSLQPGFQRREQPSLATDSREVIVSPILCLAIYEGDTLREVSPCSGPDRYHTITECLESLVPNDGS